MYSLGDFYTDFSRIDLDNTRGGYARVADVISQEDGNSVHRAFKLMRHEIDHQTAMERFEEELKLLALINQDNKHPTPVTKIFDSGFASVELSHALQQRNVPNSKLEIFPTGTNVDNFVGKWNELQIQEPGNWLPYLIIELAPFDDSMLRQIHHQPPDDTSGVYRLPTGEVVIMSLQLLDVIEYLHTNYQRAYMDWKPEHVFWSGMEKRVKMIDWNVTAPLDDGPGKEQNIRDDLRLFCGGVLYTSLTFVDPDDPMKPIGSRPTTEISRPIQQIRRRYWTDNPNFHHCEATLDNKIKEIVREGLDPNKGFEHPQQLRMKLLEYAQQELGMTEGDLVPDAEPSGAYFKALAEMRAAQRQFLKAQRHLIDMIEVKGETPEFKRLFDSIKRALVNFPIS
jgi:hypothetical protein